MRRPLGILLLLATPLLAVTACGTTTALQPGALQPRPSTTLGDWVTYHRTNARIGHVQPGLGGLHRAWSKSLTGAVYGEPLVVGSTMIVATERNYVYGLNARTGAQRWRVQLGTPQSRSGLQCGDIDPLGVTSTPAYDKVTGSVFVVAETRGGAHTLWALRATTGARRWQLSLDTQSRRDKLAGQQRSALLVTNGRVITTFGGLAGDCGNYVGYVTSAPTSGAGPVTSYAVPTAREAGMWSPPGAVRDPTTGRVFVASGNGAEVDGSWDKSDSVTELDAVTLRPLSVFAPSTWKDDNVHDYDLGSMSPEPVPAAGRIVISGKRGVTYLLKAPLRGIGSQVASLSGCTAFGGAAVVGHTVLMPCKGEYSLRALTVGTSSMHWSWTRRGVYSSPVIAAGKVYAADQRSGDLVTLRLSNGSVLARQHVGALPHFPSQIVSGNYLFVPTLNGVTAFQGS